MAVDGFIIGEIISAYNLTQLSPNQIASLNYSTRDPARFWIISRNQ